MPPRPYQPPAHNGLDIIYIDDDLIAVNKANGLLSVPGNSPEKQDCLISRVQTEYPEALIIHRLDMETSGLIILARNAPVHRAMSILFAERQVEKKYIALVDGIIETELDEINLPLRCDWPNRPKQIVDHEEGKPSLTHFREESELSTWIYRIAMNKSLDFIRKKNGELVHAAYLCYTLKEDTVHEFKMYQKEAELLHVQIVKSPSFKEDSEKKLEDNLRSALGNEVNITFEYFDHIPREESGKLRYFVSELHDDGC